MKFPGDGLKSWEKVRSREIPGIGYKVKGIDMLLSYGWAQDFYVHFFAHIFEGIIRMHVIHEYND